MRSIELVLCVVLAFGFLTLLWPRTRRGHLLSAAAVFAAIALAAHLIMEGYRWQLIPAYALTALLGLIAVWRRPGSGRAFQPNFVRVTTVVVIALVLVGTSAVATLLPVPELPEPPGPYAVGTKVLRLTDPNREEVYTDQPNDHRTFMVQIWYPAAEKGRAPAPWIEESKLFGPAIASLFDLPAFIFDHIGLVESNAYAEAAPAKGDGPFPVVLYSHGWTGFRTVSANQVEALASNGYVVISPDHSYGALVSIFPDGQVIPNKPEAIPDREAVGDEAYFAAIQTLVDAYAGDLRYLLDQLPTWNNGDGEAAVLAGLLDLERVGAFGHSTGGGAVVELCASDPRVDAALGMDVWALPVSDDLLDQPKPTPFMMMDSEIWSTEENSARLSRLWDSLKGPAYRMSIAGTRHNDFTLMPLATPLAPYMGLKGPLSGQRVVSIVDQYLVAFFDSYLRTGESGAALGDYAEFPEVSMQAKNAPSLQTE